jgi:cardiolipin synthase
MKKQDVQKNIAILFCACYTFGEREGGLVMPFPLKKVLNIPNGISFVRILLVPLFVVLYLRGHAVSALVILIISALSDLVDGRIARRFNQVTSLGKMLDPLADKITQIAFAVTLFMRFHQSTAPWMVRFSWVFLIFLGKELLMLAFAGLMLLLHKRPVAAEIYGKVATWGMYIVSGLLFLSAPEIGALAGYGLWLPEAWVKFWVILSLVLTFVSFLSYIPSTYRILFKEGKVPPSD